MALSRGSINPLNLLGVRKLGFTPPHFAKTYIDNIGEMANIDTWIYQNLNSRYCLKKTYIVSSNNKMIEACEIGIEDPKELTMLSLGCPFIHKK